uniref:Uncharacterized protein n=1 Tax=Anopheles quadriannulatus TaxID=34691 RepID=A0A182XR13_ANOQN
CCVESGSNIIQKRFDGFNIRVKIVKSRTCVVFAVNSRKKVAKKREKKRADESLYPGRRSSSTTFRNAQKGK